MVRRTDVASLLLGLGAGAPVVVDMNGAHRGNEISRFCVAWRGCYTSRTQESRPALDTAEIAANNAFLGLVCTILIGGAKYAYNTAVYMQLSQATPGQRPSLVTVYELQPDRHLGILDRQLTYGLLAD